MATIVRTESKTWKAMIRKKGFPTTVKTFRTKRDAEDWARRTEDEMVRGIYIQRAPSERLLFSEALDRYLQDVSSKKRERTQKAERTRAKPLKAFFGKYSLAAITPELIAKYRNQRLSGNDRLDQDGNPRPRSGNSVRLEMALLGHLFNVAIKEWGIGLTSNPETFVDRPAPGPGRNRRISSEEEQRLLSAIDAHSNPMLGWIVRIAIETGMRSSEITSLTLGQVNLKKRIVTLLETKNTMPRTVPLTLAAVEQFQQAIDNPVRPPDTNLVFFGEPGRGGIRKPYSFNKVWMHIKKSVGLADLRFHDLRHEAVSRFVEGGLSDQQVAAISGHKSMQMLRRYTHLRAEDLVDQLDAIEQKRSQAPRKTSL